MVAIRFEIETVSHAGRLLFDNINVVNNGEKKKIVEQIGRRKLHDLLEAIGKPGSQDTNEMLGGRLNVRVKLTDNLDYPNEVTKYMGMHAAPARQIFTPPAAPQPEPAAAPAAAAPDVDPLEAAAAQPKAPWSRAA